MNETPHPPDSSDIPEAVAAPKRKHSLQLVWLIPLVAAIIGGTLAVRTYLQKGPTITIRFKTGDGLEAGKTKIKFKDVEIGVVTEVTLNREVKGVIATAELHKGVTPHLVEDTKFWVVRPRISGGTVTGLGTLMGGSYIGTDIGTSKKPSREFTGLEAAPAVAMDVPGSRFVLHSPDLGSLDVGSPLFFRRIKVGQVISYSLDRDGGGVTFTVFVEKPYDAYVKTNTRFWHASGIDLSMDANGLKLNTQSLVSIMVGGIAFQTLEDEVAPPLGPNTVFALYTNRDEAMKHRDTISNLFTLIFKESVRGLSVGAPVDFRGVIIGEVASINAEFDGRTKEVNMRVEVRIYPERMRARSVGPLPVASAKVNRVFDDALVARGLRAQLKGGNLLTGQLMVALDFFPNASKARIRWDTNPPQFPTTPSSLVELQTMVAQLGTKLEKLPMEEVVGELRQTVQTLDSVLRNADSMVRRIDAEVVPETKATMTEARTALAAAKQTLESDAPLQQDLREALRELARAAQSLRVLTDYLDRHPESLLRGKGEEKP